MAYNGFDQRVMLKRGSGGSAVTRRLISDRDGRLLEEYGSAGNQLFTEYIWLLPEAGDGDQIFGGDDGSGGWMPLAVATANGIAGVANETLRYIHSTHLGVPVGTYSSTGTASPLPTGTMLLVPLLSSAPHGLGPDTRGPAIDAPRLPLYRHRVCQPLKSRPCRP